jgi:hypothetical protein
MTEPRVILNDSRASRWCGRVRAHKLPTTPGEAALSSRHDLSPFSVSPCRQGSVSLRSALQRNPPRRFAILGRVLRHARSSRL